VKLVALAVIAFLLVVFPVSAAEPTSTGPPLAASWRVMTTVASNSLYKPRVCVLPLAAR
jgi:hypothetical protein